MFADRLARRLDRAGIHDGWAIVIVSLMSITTLATLLIEAKRARLVEATA
jgi:hypothetical protein